MSHRFSQSGFSLLELIVVVVLLGVLASGAGLLITKPIEAYNDQLRRLQLVDQAEMALRQIARDVRRALPNSLREQAVAGGWALEMVNTIDGARYRDEAGAPFNSVDDRLTFSTADTSFNLLGRFNSITAASLPSNQRLVIYNTAPSDIYADVTANSNPGIVTTDMTSIALPPSGDEQRLTMNPPFQFSQQSPGQRIFVIDGAISYICNPATRTITRYDNYAYQLNQPTTDIALSALGGVQSGRVVNQVASCNLSYDSGSAQRGGLVSMQVTLDDPVNQEKISLLHQVHVVNVP